MEPQGTALIEEPDPRDTAPQEGRPEEFGECLRDMSGIARGWGRTTAAILLHAAGDAVLRRAAERPAQAEPSADLVRLIYVSRPTTFDPHLASRRAVAILATARRHNAEAQLTGALVRSRRWFAQVLEGERAAVEGLYARIQADQRHCDLRLLSMRPLQVRAFADWAMANAGDAPDRLIRNTLDDLTTGGSGQRGLREMMNLMIGRLRVA